MEVITIESEAFKRILTQLEEIKSGIDKSSKRNPLSDPLLDNNEASALLKVSKGTLQSYRDQGDISFIQVGSKIYYRSSDIEEFLKKHLKIAFNKNH